MAAAKGGYKADASPAHVAERGAWNPERPKTSYSSPPAFTQLVDLASSDLGTKVVFATDEWFADATMMINPKEPVWDADAFTFTGKWMDGWESRRRRSLGHDFCVLKLGKPGILRGFDIDTSYFTGNYTPVASIQAAVLPDDFALPRGGGERGTKATDAEIEEARLATAEWEVVCPQVRLRPGVPDTRHNYFACDAGMIKDAVSGRMCERRFTHIRLNMYPDGGIARLRVHGIIQRDWANVAATDIVDLAAVENGGRPLAFSDAHYGRPVNLIMEGRGENMGHGWETARRMDRPEVFVNDEAGNMVIPGSEWVLLRLGIEGVITSVDVDTHFFRGNFPESVTLEGCCLPDKTDQDFDDAAFRATIPWVTLLKRSKLTSDTQHLIQLEGQAASTSVTHVRMTMFPDGGVMRLRLYGHPAKS